MQESIGSLFEEQRIHRDYNNKSRRYMAYTLNFNPGKKYQITYY